MKNPPPSSATPSTIVSSVDPRLATLHRNCTFAFGTGTLSVVSPTLQRTTFGREGARYDIIARDGMLGDRVSLPEGHRVIGFGRDAMYVVRRDADDLEFLQRRPLPR